MLVLLLSPAAAQATTITVNSTADNLSGCTLRNAVKAANLNTPRGTCPAGEPSPMLDKIDFSVPSGSKITLTSALDPITERVNISGPGQGKLNVSGADKYQPLKVNAGATVSISGLKVSHGSCTCAGGAISNSGNLTLNRVTVTQSSSTNVFGVGGGIDNEGGTMTLQNTTVSSNTVSASGGANQDARGGGIYNFGTMNVVLSTITGNTVSASGATNQTSARGAGIYNDTNSSLTIDRSTISSNTATADALGGTTATANGGGIINLQNLTMTRSTLSGNTVSAVNGGGNTAEGGGILSIPLFNPGDANITIDRSTIAGNTATAGASVSHGGGMEIQPGVYTITSSTIAHNSADSGANLSNGSTPDFKNTIVSDPEGGGSNCDGSAPGTSSHDLSSDGTCGFTGAGDHLNTDPNLAASLADNGGATKTYALQSGSPAIDKGLSSAGETVDQRGIKRPSDFPTIANAPGGNGTDIGAFELSDPTAIVDSGPSGTTNDPTPTFTFHAKDGASTLQCRLDAGSFAACASPKTTAHLADGAHTFQVRARDALGNFGATASRSFTVKTASISRSGSTLIVSGAGGAKDNFKVAKPSTSTIRITDLPGGAYTGSGIHVVGGSGCTRSGDYTADCSASGIALVKVVAAGGTDRVTNTTALPSSLSGGAASDVLTGGARDDTLTGGAGADIFKGMNGNDSLLARDSTTDTAVDCDGGTKPGTADKAILDAPAIDPDSIIHGCETKSRP